MVKPVELMRHLVRLVTPPGGRVLDPFNGSGTTGLAAMLEGFEYTGIEQDPHYGAISRARWKSPRWVERAEVHRAERAGEPPPVKVSKAKAKRVSEGQEPLWETMPDGQS